MTNAKMTPRAMRFLGLAALALATFAAALPAQSTREPKVEIAWNRFYDYDGIVDLCRRLAASRPDLCTLQFIGPSWEGRPMPLLTIQNPATGPEWTKSAMWVDGNVHGNEVQGAEAAVYLAWTLLERYEELPSITELVDERVFYILPMVNPDGRQFWFTDPNTPHSSRSGKRPLDNDHDGVADEDGQDDLDGDGELLMMRKRVEPGTGDYRLDPSDPRQMQRVPQEKRVEWGADYVLLGGEGYDNDGDGRVNEDGPGGYDMNRNWPSDWQPNYIQYGAGDFPFSYPETEAIGKFLMEHKNVAAVQSFHNSGGMILRGPGTESRGDMYPSSDVRTYDAIANDGERILPFYKNMVLWRDLYDVHGGFVN
ncbi:MAG: M14 family metallopeptidase, partial [Planctomycetota bacterium]